MQHRRGCLPVPVGTLRAKAAGREDDQRWVTAMNFRHAERCGVRGAGGRGFDQDIRGAEQGFKHRPVRRVAQIAGEGFFTQVGGGEGQADAGGQHARMAVRGTRARFHAHHIGPEFSQMPPDGRQRPGSQIEHPHPMQGRVGIGLHRHALASSWFCCPRSAGDGAGFAERHVAVQLHFARQAQHPLADDVALDLVGTAAD